ncbi:hypothetical protein Ancab_008943 [Ancistrocladus abbreviatus]
MERWQRETEEDEDSSTNEFDPFKSDNIDLSTLSISEEVDQSDAADVSAVPGGSLVHYKLRISFAYLHHELNKEEISFGLWTPELGPALMAGGGVILTDSKEEWVVGFAMRLGEISRRQTLSEICVQRYRTLREGLQLAWSQGIKSLKVELDSTFQLLHLLHFKGGGDQSYNLLPQVEAVADDLSAILKEIKDYLNRDWEIDIRFSPLFLFGRAFAMCMLAFYQKQENQVYDFSSHPLTELIDILAHAGDWTIGLRIMLGRDARNENFVGDSYLTTMTTVIKDTLRLFELEEILHGG